MFQPPDVTHLEYLSDFPNFLSDSVLRTDKVIIVGDLNISVDINNDSFRTDKSTDPFNHTLDLVELIYGVEVEDMSVFPQICKIIF